MKKFTLILSAFVLLFTACKKDNDAVEVSNATSTDVKYKVTFQGKWHQGQHELASDFPSNPHFSPPVGAVHKAGYNLYESGKIPSPGIELMAETGAPTTLISEIDQAGNLVKSSFRAASAITGGMGTISWEIALNKDFHLVSLVNMIAPSPDWFIGTKNIDLYPNNTWVNSLTVDGVLYDAGSDNGAKFTSPDDDTNPKGRITVMDSTILKAGGQMLVGPTNERLILGEWKFEKLP